MGGFRTAIGANEEARVQAVTDWSDTLEAAVASGDEDRLVGALKTIRGPGEVPDIVKILKDAPSSRVRNAAAIALADIHPTNAAEVLIEVLSKPETKNSRGTLLYALEEVGAKAPLKLLAEIILSDTYEARQEALRFITSRNIRTTRHELSEVLQKFEASSPIDDEQAASIREAISALEDWRGDATKVHRRHGASGGRTGSVLSFVQLAVPVAGLTKLPNTTVKKVLRKSGALLVQQLVKGNRVRIGRLDVLLAGAAVAKKKKSSVKIKKSSKSTPIKKRKRHASKT
jgi:hypothetical protein